MRYGFKQSLKCIYIPQYQCSIYVNRNYGYVQLSMLVITQYQFHCNLEPLRVNRLSLLLITTFTFKNNISQAIFSKFDFIFLDTSVSCYLEREIALKMLKQIELVLRFYIFIFLVDILFQKTFRTFSGECNAFQKNLQCLSLKHSPMWGEVLITMAKF